MLRSSRIRVPPSRTIVCDILRYDRTVPTFAHDRVFNLGELVDARRDVQPRISWPAIFMKAYALNATRFHRLQQTWMSWPWSHLYQHHEHVGTLVVHRQLEGDDWLFWGQMTDLESRSLADIQGQVDRFQSQPAEEVFRRQLWLAQQFQLFRRLAWWLTFNLSGKKKCKRLGTFFLSTISGSGAEIQNPPSMLTSGFTYGPIDKFGATRVTITYDHRIMDGHHVADILRGLESALQTTILDELREMSIRRSAA